MERAWILSSTRWWSFSMYMTPTVTSWSNGSPVRPSKSTDWQRRAPLLHRASRISSSRAPSKTGVATWMPRFSLADELRDLAVGQRRRSARRGGRSRGPSSPSKTFFSFFLQLGAGRSSSRASPADGGRRCAPPSRGGSRGSGPTFMRDGTPSGLSTMSTGVPSSRYGMSSSGRMRETTPLLPWRPAILSPTASLRLMAT